MWTFLISKLSVGELISVVGQLDGSCESHCGPFHHSVDVDNLMIHLCYVSCETHLMCSESEYNRIQVLLHSGTDLKYVIQ